MAEPQQDDLKVGATTNFASTTPAAEVLPAEILESPQVSTYQVPRQFGLASLLAMFTTFGLLFGLLRAADAPAGVYWFLSALALAIGGSQMLFNREPRMVSIVAGTIFLPLIVALSIFAGAALSKDRPVALIWPAIICTVVGSIPTGGFVGYCVGTLLAGVFLVTDHALRFSTRRERENLSR